MNLIDMIVVSARQAGALHAPVKLSGLFDAFRRAFPTATTGQTAESFSAQLCYHCINMRSRFPDPQNRRAAADWLRKPRFKRIGRGTYMLL